MHMVNAMDVRSSSCFFYPRLIPLVRNTLSENNVPVILSGLSYHPFQCTYSIFLWKGSMDFQTENLYASVRCGTVLGLFQ